MPGQRLQKAKDWIRTTKKIIGTKEISKTDLVVEAVSLQKKTY